MDAQQLAASILTRAVKCDTEGKYTQALCLYQEGLEILLSLVKTKRDEACKAKLRQKITEYMNRAEEVKSHIESLKKDGKYREQIQIQKNDVGYSYHSVFSNFLSPSIKRVEIEDPYIITMHQCDNFLRFVELLCKSCATNLSIHLITTKGENDPLGQSERLDQIQASLSTSRAVELTISYSDSLHDREIRLDNGWVIKIGRGLDYFQKVDRFSIGYFDFDLRPCKETTIDIYHRGDLAKNS